MSLTIWNHVTLQLFTAHLIFNEQRSNWLVTKTLTSLLDGIIRFRRGGIEVRRCLFFFKFAITKLLYIKNYYRCILFNLYSRCRPSSLFFQIMGILENRECLNPVIDSFRTQMCLRSTSCYQLSHWPLAKLDSTMTSIDHISILCCTQVGWYKQRKWGGGQEWVGYLKKREEGKERMIAKRVVWL